MKYIVANWKMKMTSQNVLDWLNKWKELTKNKNFEDITILICPTNIHIPLVKEFLKNREVVLALGAQDISKSDKGSHTGQIGAYQVKEFADYSIVGHSERKESEEIVLAKIEQCLKNNITPITCFVDTSSATNYQSTGKILAWEDPANISINGQYRDKDPEEVIEGISKTREILDEDITLLYGGSVNRQNIHNLVNIEGLDGVLIGNASLDPEHFLEIVKAYI